VLSGRISYRYYFPFVGNLRQAQVTYPGYLSHPTGFKSVEAVLLEFGTCPATKCVLQAKKLTTF